MKEKYVVYRYGSIRFSGNAEEFKSFMVEHTKGIIAVYQRDLAKLQVADESEVLELAQCSDDWHIEVNEPFKNSPRFKG